MKFKSSALAASVLSLSLSVASAAVYQPVNHMHVRGSVGFGLRYINDEVMSPTKWDSGREIGLGIFQDAGNHDYYYGLEAFSNNSWSARFNSVNDADDTDTSTLNVYNSSSI